MSNINLSQVSQKLVETLPERQRNVLVRRFNLLPSKKERGKETLESIGKDYGITRERVRQIERDGILRLKSKVKEYKQIFQSFTRYVKKIGGLKREDILLEDLGGKDFKDEVYFLLHLAQNFERISETEDLHTFWSTDKKYSEKAFSVIETVEKKLNEIGKPRSLKELMGLTGISENPKFISSYLEISKKVQQNKKGYWGMRDWPEINPRGVKDKAYLVLKETQKPLHFNEVAGLIEQALPQTVHNELIKDPRFVLVGRGIYALREWGYERGYVKDVISKVLKESQRPLSKEEILDQVLKQRLVKSNTVILNLSNKKYFSKTSDGNYTVREA